MTDALPSSLMACILFCGPLRQTSGRMVLCLVHVLAVRMVRITLRQAIHVHLFKSGFMPHYNVWTKHGEREVMMEDNEEEEDDDSYPGHGFPEYDDTTMGEEKLSRQCGKKLKKRHQMSPLMI